MMLTPFRRGMVSVVQYLSWEGPHSQPSSSTGLPMSRNLATTNVPVNGMDRIVMQSIQQLLPVLEAVSESRETLIFGIVHDFGDV
jgi:hypothetical protein